MYQTKKYHNYNKTFIFIIINVLNIIYFIFYLYIEIQYITT